MLRRALLSVSSRTLAASSLRGGLASITETACRASCSAPVWRGIEAGSCRAGSAEQGFAAMGLRLRGVHSTASTSAEESTAPLAQMPTPVAGQENTEGVVRSSGRTRPHFGAFRAKDRSEHIAYSRISGIHMSPKKLNAVAQLVRGLHVSEARAQLGILQKRGARFVEKALTAAIANGVNNHGLDQERMVVGLAYVGRGTPLPRIDFRARGKSGSKDRARAHLTVVVEEKPSMDLARGKFRAIKGGFSQDASVAAWEKHQSKRGGSERAERLKKLLKRRPEGMWAQAAVPPLPAGVPKFAAPVAAAARAGGAAGGAGGARAQQ